MLTDSLFASASAAPDSLAIIDESGSYTYGQLASSAGALGKYLATKNTRPRIGLLLPASSGFVASFYGALLAGKTVVPLNFLLSDREIAHCVSDSEIDTVVTIPQLAGRVEGLSLNTIDLTKLPRAVAGAPIVAPAHTVNPDDVAVLMYTSGTSGLPKGVPLTYRNLQSNVDASITHVAFQRGHKFLGVVPLFHAFGLTAMMLAPIQLGATIIYLARFSPVGTLNAIKEHGISIMGGLPSMFGAMLRLKDASSDHFKSIYAMISGGEPLPRALGDAFHERFGVPLYEAYGMTETSLAITVSTPQMHKPGSVGKPIAQMEINIVDEAGKSVTPGDEGEIWVRGPMVTKGYHQLPTETAAAFTPSGHFKTGDLGRFDADGFLFITGRKKDLIIVAGEKVAPREIEELLRSHPAIAEAAVVGETHDTRGQVVAAFVVAREGHSPQADGLREFCRESGLAQFKVPRQVYIVLDLPRSPTGKVLKRELRPPPTSPDPH